MRSVLPLSFIPVVCRGLLFLNLLLGGVAAIGQETSPLPDAPQPSQIPSGQSRPQQDSKQHEPSKNHIFWVIPNYRSDENPAEIKPLTPGTKMKVALDDSFDPSAFLVAGIFAGVAMVQRQYSSFGPGAQGFGKYYGGAFADQAIGNIMSEGLFPVALHQERADFGSGLDTLSAGKLSLVAMTAATTSTHQSWPEMPWQQVFPTSIIQPQIDH
jgi:hypothetical protein